MFTSKILALDPKLGHLADSTLKLTYHSFISPDQINLFQPCEYLIFASFPRSPGTNVNSKQVNKLKENNRTSSPNTTNHTNTSLIGNGLESSLNNSDAKSHGKIKRKKIKSEKFVNGNNSSSHSRSSSNESHGHKDSMEISTNGVAHIMSGRRSVSPYNQNKTVLNLINDSENKQSVFKMKSFKKSTSQSPVPPSAVGAHANEEILNKLNEKVESDSKTFKNNSSTSNGSGSKSSSNGGSKRIETSFSKSDLNFR